MDFTVNLISAPGPPGIDGIQGEDGKDGPTVISQIVEKRGEETIENVPMGAGNYGGVFSLPPHCAYVVLKFKVGGVNQANYSNRRVFFEAPDSYGHRKEISLGNAYLRLSSTQDGTLERTVLSMERTLIAVPDSPEGEFWQVVVNDKGDVGFEVVDLGYRHVLRRLENAEDVEGFEYSEPFR
jgi:hypothetical protein